MAFNYFPDINSGRISAPKFQPGISQVPGEKQLFSLFELPSQSTLYPVSSGSLRSSPFNLGSRNLRHFETRHEPKAPDSQGFRKSLTRYSPLPQFYLFLKIRKNNSVPPGRSCWTNESSKKSNKQASLSVFYSPIRKRGPGTLAVRSLGFSQLCPVRSCSNLLNGSLISSKGLSIKVGKKRAKCARS